MDNAGSYYTTQAAARILSVSPDTLRRYAAQGLIVALQDKPGTHRKYLAASVDAYRDILRQGAERPRGSMPTLTCKLDEHETFHVVLPESFQMLADASPHGRELVQQSVEMALLSVRGQLQYHADFTAMKQQIVSDQLPDEHEGIMCMFGPFDLDEMTAYTSDWLAQIEGSSPTANLFDAQLVSVLMYAAVSIHEGRRRVSRWLLRIDDEQTMREIEAALNWVHIRGSASTDQDPSQTWQQLSESMTSGDKQRLAQIAGKILQSELPYPDSFRALAGHSSDDDEWPWS